MTQTKTSEKAKKVNLNGVNLWLMHPNEGDSPLGEPEHFNEAGEFNIEHFTTDSYAHVFGNRILRYGSVIGERKDLKDGWVES